MEEKVAETGRKIASHAVVFRGLVLPSSPYDSPKNDCMGGQEKNGICSSEKAQNERV